MLWQIQGRFLPNLVYEKETNNHVNLAVRFTVHVSVFSCFANKPQNRRTIAQIHLLFYFCPTIHMILFIFLLSVRIKGEEICCCNISDILWLFSWLYLHSTFLLIFILNNLFQQTTSIVYILEFFYRFLRRMHDEGWKKGHKYKQTGKVGGEKILNP